MSSHESQSLADIGQQLWGARWAQPMAEALGVSERDVVRWDANPETMPADLEAEINLVAAARSQQIQAAMARLDLTGLRRSQ